MFCPEGVSSDGRGEVRGILLRAREQAHTVLFLAEMPRKLPMSLRNCNFFSPELFQREFHNTQPQHRAGAVGARAVGFSAQ